MVKHEEKKGITETLKATNGNVRELETALLKVMLHHGIDSLPTTGDKVLKVERKLKETRRQ